MNKTIAVVGAGISGLLLARDLQARGADVVVLEKSRGVGGRLATKRVGPAVFDQGAQFFTVRDERFRTVVNEWRGAGIATTWPGRETERVIGVAGMTALPKALAASLPLQREHRVTRAMRHASGCWELEIETHGMLRAERLVLTAPVPQSLALLEPGLLAPAVHEALSLLTYHPCLALLLALDGPSAVPPEGFAPSAGAIRWVADNSLKGVSPGPAGALTLHTTPAFAAQHYGESVEEVAARLRSEIEPWLGGSGIVSTTLHRWKFSEPKAAHPEPFVWLPDLALGFCGDSFGGPRVEGAAVSGLALAARIATTLARVPAE
jgi:predicted NAD/FAD-dependent oxidoreductase